MVLVAHNDSGEIQRAYLSFYQSLITQKLLTIDSQWGNLSDETDETDETEETEQEGAEALTSPTSQKPEHSLQKKIDSSSTQAPKSSLNQEANSPSPEPKESSFKKEDNSLFPQPKEEQLLIFQVQLRTQLVDEIELSEGGVKSQQTTSDSERLLGQIEILQTLPKGTIIQSAPSLNVKVIEKQGNKIISSQTVLATDEQGKITHNILDTSQQKTGTQVIDEQLNCLQNSAIVDYLEQLIETRVSSRLNQINQTNNPAFLEAKTQREKEPSNPRWWQEWLQKGGELISTWRQQWQQNQAAKKLYYWTEKQANTRQARYSSQDYTIVSQPIGNQQRYTLFNRNNQPILSFDVDRQKRLSIINSNLSQDDYRAIQSFGQKSDTLTNNNQANEQIMLRANNLAAKFVEMAQRQQQSMRRTGDSYTLAIDPNGDVEISALDGRGVIYHQTFQGHQPVSTNLMTDTDLTYFERQFQSPVQKPQTPVSHTTPTVGKKSRSR